MVCVEKRLCLVYFTRRACVSDSSLLVIDGPRELAKDVRGSFFGNLGRARVNRQRSRCLADGVRFWPDKRGGGVRADGCSRGGRAEIERAYEERRAK